MAESVAPPLPLPPEIEEAWKAMNDPDAAWDERWDAADDLRRLLREFEPRLVEAARLEGATWTEIGRALGISKQAAQQRYGS